jgi:Family of unknown function (DUF5996)
MESNKEIDAAKFWPALPLASWQDTCETLHMWTQIVGKVRLALSPPVNHWWHVTLYVNSRGLTTSAIPYRGSVFELQFDFLQHQLVLRTAEAGERSLSLAPRSVAGFYRDFQAMLRSADIEVPIWRMPVEIPNPIPFDEDEVHAAYDRDAVQKFWRILVSAQTVFQRFRSGFIGKCSPVHFFWGSFDLAVTRFSGRRAPERPGADTMTREAYSHEASSVGFWPGAGLGDPAFYSYAAPEPEGFSAAPVRPEAAHYDPQLREFILMYDQVRKAASPSAALMEFCESTYGAAADLGCWPRKALER